VSAGVGTTGAGASAPRVTPDPSTSPFTSKTAFCTKDTAKHTGLKATAPGVTADKISVVAIEPALQPGQSPQGYRYNLGDEVDMLKTFAQMINDCGGINGRQVDPMRLKLPRGRILEGPMLASFEQERDHFRIAVGACERHRRDAIAVGLRDVGSSAPPGRMRHGQQIPAAVVSRVAHLYTSPWDFTIGRRRSDPRRRGVSGCEPTGPRCPRRRPQAR